MTADELKKAMKEYANEHCPGGYESISAIVCVGRGDSAETLAQEALLVLGPLASPERPNGRKPRPASSTRRRTRSVGS